MLMKLQRSGRQGPMGEVPCVRWIRSQDSSRRSTATAAAALRQVLTWGDDDESGATSRSSERTTASQWMASRSLRGSGRNSGQRSTATAAAALTWGRRRRETDRELGERKPLVHHRVRRGWSGGRYYRRGGNRDSSPSRRASSQGEQPDGAAPRPSACRPAPCARVPLADPRAKPPGPTSRRTRLALAAPPCHSSWRRSSSSGRYGSRRRSASPGRHEGRGCRDAPG